MFNSNVFPDNFDFIDPNIMQSEFQYFMPPLDSFPDLPMEMFPFPDYEGPESAQMLQLFDQALQTYTNEFMKMLPNTINPEFQYEVPSTIEKPKFCYKNAGKIGTISAEERREKVLRFLEKRKRRVYTKKISYLCRKRVADQRERFKGRFISKKVETVENLSPSEN